MTPAALRDGGRTARTGIALAADAVGSVDSECHRSPLQRPRHHDLPRISPPDRNPRGRQFASGEFVHTGCAQVEGECAPPLQTYAARKQAELRSGRPMDLARPGRTRPAPPRPTLARNRRRPWERPAKPNRITPPGPPGEDRHASQCTKIHQARPGPGRPLGSKNRQPATRYDVGRVIATSESYTRPAHHKVGTKPRRSSEPSTAV
jgi:hypothetical protein